VKNVWGNLGSLLSRVKPAQTGSTLRGFVDRTEEGNVLGWAADLDHPDQPVTVEVREGGTPIAWAVADLYRNDLKLAGFGNGRHAFQCALPASYSGLPGITITAQIQGTDFLLPYQSKTQFLVETPPLFSYIAADIVNNCNLRCPFCVVDYSDVTKTELMSDQTFTRMLGLLRAVPTAGFWLSCLHEPTLHPRLNQFLEMIPRDSRHKFWFTTNLAMPIGEETFIAWATSGLHHINVSLDTMNDELFAVLRKFGRYKIFHQNLDRLAKVFRQYPNAPKLRYITIAFRSNFDEIPKIVEHSHTHWLSVENEIRYTYNMAHIVDEFRQEHYLRKDDWPVLTERLARLPYHYVIAYPPEEGYEETIMPSANYFEIQKADQLVPRPSFDRPFQLRARPDGTLVIVGRESQFSVNINSLDDPITFFRTL
jgi:MoaA/NifB/PqqE/SkfB family radical SAM enzyme